MPLTRTKSPAGRAAGAALVVLAAGLAVPGRTAGEPAGGEPAVIRDGFEAGRTAWGRERTDATVNLLAHDRSDRAAHEGRVSEHVRFSAGLGSGFYFSYPLPKVPVTEDLKAVLYVRANRAGVQLFARVVLPADTDPETKQPSFLLVPGTIFDNVDRWQRLEVSDLLPSLERQARVLRASSRRPVSLEGAYVEQLVVNLFTGSGETEVFLDDLSVGPVPAEVAAAHAGAPDRDDGGDVPAPGPDVPAAAGPLGRVPMRARLDRNRLKKRAPDGLYHDWVFTAVEAPGADVGALRNSGFDVLIEDARADPARLAEAVRRGFLLMPKVGDPAGAGDVDPGRVADRARAFPQGGAVLAWLLGDHLGRTADLDQRRERLDAARATVTRLRDLPPGVSPLATGVVDDLLPLYAQAPRGLPLLGIRPNAWGSSLSPANVSHFLRQRRDLTVRGNAGALFWAELPAVPPPEFARAVWGEDIPPPWGTPAVQPEQLRLMTYAALSAGYRGIAYKADADLTRGPGRVLLLEMAMLNAEIDLCESVLSNGTDPIPVYNAYPNDPVALQSPPRPGMKAQIVKSKESPPLGEIRAAALGTSDRKGLLLLVSDQAFDSQYQPAQLARNDVNLTVIVPEGAEAYQISPGRFAVVEQRQRTVGGTRYTLEEFDTTALVLVTTDEEMARRVEAAVNAIAPRAAQMAIEQAELKLQWVTDINGRLAALGHYLILDKERKTRSENGAPESTDQADLLRKAAENIKAARENAERLDWANAWAEARRASRPLRVLMKGLWDNAREAMVRANTPPEVLALEEKIKLGKAKPPGPPLIVPPVASPPLLSWNTLPQHYLWVDAMKGARFSRNLIPSGTFDSEDEIKAAGWVNESYPYEGIVGKVVTDDLRKRDARLMEGKEPEKDKDGKDKEPKDGDDPTGDGRRRVRLIVTPVPGRSADTLTPYIDHPAAAIRSPAVKVKAGQLLRISVMIQRRWNTPQGAGGIVVRDSIGGEPLQYVCSDPVVRPGKLILYRRAPADGDFTVTLGLAAYGDAYFDDLTVERVEAAPEATPPDVARARPSPRAPRPTAR